MGRARLAPHHVRKPMPLHQALVAAGELHLAAVPLICFEWHQRPENVLAGLSDLGRTTGRADRPNTVRIEHHKTGRCVPLPLSDRDGPLFPGTERRIWTALSGSAYPDRADEADTAPRRQGGGA